jgi:DUF971 family protein
MHPEQMTNRRAAGVLEVRWNDGVAQALSHRQLRAACRCSPCQAARLRGQPVVPAGDVRLDRICPVGQYAVQLIFSDGHARGIYPWEWLRDMGDPALPDEVLEASSFIAQ